MKNVLMAVFIASYFMLCMDDGWAMSCPDGWYAIDESYTSIDNTCSTGYMDMGSAETCDVANPNSECYLFAPTGVSYSDNSGTYEYTEPCEFEEESSSSSS